MKILVTGASGFAGGYILGYLSEKMPGAHIYGTGRNRMKVDEMKKKGFKMIEGSLNDPEFVSSELDSFTHIIHCAARTSIWGKYSDFYRDNVEMTKNLLGNIPALKSFIYISTANIYFNFKDRLGVKEDDPLPRKHVTWYPVTKLLGEKEVLNVNNSGMYRVVLRPRGIIGPGDTTSFPRILRAFEENKIKIVGKGNNIIDFTSVKNLAQAAYLCLKEPAGTNGRAYNISDGEELDFWKLLLETTAGLGYNKKPARIPYPVVYAAASVSEIIARLGGGSEPSLTRYSAGVMKTSFTLDISRARKELGYEPVISSGETVEEFLDWYKDGTKVV